MVVGPRFSSYERALERLNLPLIIRSKTWFNNEICENTIRGREATIYSYTVCSDQQDY